MANNPSLPLEVIGEIIHQVTAEDDSRLSSTKACALVCHSILPLCRNHIFASVTLNPRQASAFPTRDSDDIDYLLSKSPHLAVYIRKMVYHIDAKETFTKKWSSSAMSVFKKLVKLQALSICYIRLGRQLDWMLPQTRQGLLPLLHFPTLTDISLCGIENLLFGRFGRIGFLECSTDVGRFLEALPTTPVMLEQLIIERQNSVNFVQRLCHARRPDRKPIIDFSSLKKIVAEVAQIDSMKELFGLCTNLREVDLCVRGVASSSNLALEGLFAMLRPSLPTLRDIRIKNRHEESVSVSVSGLCHELEKIVGENTVETIKLDWPALKEVSLLINVIDDYTQMSYSEEVALKRFIVTQFTKLAESKQVRFKIAVDMYQYISIGAASGALAVDFN
ncbi:hypothetical protein BYT27DRAFT_7336460 [Phlegmacium glaucopus]|nr:hypothetical protein BYT27DRAFT_7336460 [Phlegmacium glaucopus]